MALSTTSNQLRTWELSPYELQRKPHSLLPDSTMIEVSARMIQNELTCPICLDILKQTMTTKECLHRFCNECITTALRSGNKECPSCRKKLVSKRSLRADLNFDALINHFYPNRSDLDQFQENVLSKLPNASAISASKVVGRSRRRKSTVNATESVADVDEQMNGNAFEVAGSSASVKRTRIEPCEFEIVCAPHPTQAGYVRHLKSQPHIAVKHLTSYIHIRERVMRSGDLKTGRFPISISANNDHKYKIYAKDLNNGDNTLVELSADLNLADVASKYGLHENEENGNRVLMLHYQNVDN
ncbi:hypothetical protein GJ496_003659 [Pomphorhynchus laevis]|nr:hypothetical protein GJ496_003659 [Pomphorhynchus laevis]